jgi:hypothetical protein
MPPPFAPSKPSSPPLSAAAMANKHENAQCCAVDRTAGADRYLTQLLLLLLLLPLLPRNRRKRLAANIR